MRKATGRKLSAFDGANFETLQNIVLPGEKRSFWQPNQVAKSREERTPEADVGDCVAKHIAKHTAIDRLAMLKLYRLLDR